MKKLLISVIVALLLILTVVSVVKGWQIGGLSILGVKGIQEKNEDLDAKIQAATKLASNDYLRSIDDLNANLKKLQNVKKNYEDMVSVSSEGEVQASKQFQKYSIDFLWIRIGTHAKSEGIEIKMVVAKGSNNTQDTYNLNFTATGSYIGIADFIRDIEDDSSLGFKIEEFKMAPSSTGQDIQATFVCKNIAIKDISQMTLGTDTTTVPNANTDTTNTTNTVQ